MKPTGHMIPNPNCCSGFLVPFPVPQDVNHGLVCSRLRQTHQCGSLAFYNTASPRMLTQLVLEAAQMAHKRIFVESKLLLLAGWLASRNTQPTNLGSFFCNNCQKWKNSPSSPEGAASLTSLIRQRQAETVIALRKV